MAAAHELLAGSCYRNVNRPTVAFCRAPMLSGLDQGRSDEGPSVALYAAAQEVEGREYTSPLHTFRCVWACRAGHGTCVLASQAPKDTNKTRTP